MKKTISIVLSAVLALGRTCRMRSKDTDYTNHSANSSTNSSTNYTCSDWIC